MSVVVVVVVVVVVSTLWVYTLSVHFLEIFLLTFFLFPSYYPLRFSLLFLFPRKPRMIKFIDQIPFDFYVVVRDVLSLPEILGDSLRQWWESMGESGEQ